jgi:hypothetical protein
MSSCSFDNLSFYVGQSPSDWKRIPLSTDLFYLRYHSLDGVLCENIGTNEYIFVLEALKIPDETQGFYLIRFTMNGTSMEVLSLGWLIAEKEVWYNGGPLAALDSNGKLHIAWCKSEGDRDDHSEIYYDFQGSGYGILDWSLLE